MAVTVVSLSQLSMTMHDGRILSWLKREDDAVKEGEPLLAVETDKVEVEIPAPASGYVRKILAEEGEVIQMGGNLCLIAEKEDDLTAYLDLKNLRADSVNANNTPDKKEELPHSNIQDDEIRRPKISQLAREAARQYGIDVNTIAGTGPGGLIVKADIEKILTTKTRGSAPVHTRLEGAAVESEVIPLQGARKRIAEHLTLSKRTVADVTTVTEVDMTQVAALRKTLPVRYTAFVVKAAAKGLQEFPILNSSMIGEEIHLWKGINVCVAVAIDTGVVTPVIKNTDKKHLMAIAEEIEQFSRKSKEHLLTPEDLADGTFTVTNSGVFGSLFFTPIINYPQSAVLGMGKVMKTPVVREDDIAIASMMYLCLTYDHRIVDGAPAVKFLQKVKYYLENPDKSIFSKVD